MITNLDIALQHQAPRLVLRILNEKDAPMVLDFQSRNAAVFEQFEADRPEMFYTLKYQQAILRAEMNAMQSKNCLRFWIFLQEQPDRVIGTVSFHYLIHEPFHTCQIGYKFDPEYWHKGYATEALQMAIDIASGFLNLHRIEAYVRPDNTASIRLLEKLHFERECLSKHCILLNNTWTDHYRYALILES